MSIPFKVPIEDPETDLAWVAYMIRRCLTNSEKFRHREPDYRLREAHSLGITTDCFREMRKL